MFQEFGRHADPRIPHRDEGIRTVHFQNNGDLAVNRELRGVGKELANDLPEFDRTKLKTNTVKGSQFLRPLFEYSGACAACGETPYVKLVSQLFGDRAIMSNATGCSSIYGGNLPTTPWAKNREGRGPTWSNSLFEDNAEFGFGFRLTIDKHREYACELVLKLADQIGSESAAAMVNADQSDEAGVTAQRERVAQLKEKLATIDTPESRNLQTVADALVKRSV